MSYQVTLAAALGLCAVAFYLLARLLEENRELLARRKVTSALIRHPRRRRDAYSTALRFAGDDYEELEGRCVELEAELKNYRAEDARRVGRERVWL